MGLSARVRFEVLKRDGFRCAYCGRRKADGTWLDVDHVHPRSLGGKDDPINLVAACTACNAGKSNISLYSLGIPDIHARCRKEMRSWQETGYAFALSQYWELRLGQNLRADMDLRGHAWRYYPIDVFRAIDAVAATCHPLDLYEDLLQQVLEHLDQLPANDRRMGMSWEEENHG